MENQGVIYKIKSSYILKWIFTYIKDKNLQFKIFIYSKCIKKKLNIQIIDYKQKYLQKIGFDIFKYLHSKQ